MHLKGESLPEAEVASGSWWARWAVAPPPSVEGIEFPTSHCISARAMESPASFVL